MQIPTIYPKSSNVASTEWPSEEDLFTTSMINESSSTVDSINVAVTFSTTNHNLRIVVNDYGEIRLIIYLLMGIFGTCMVCGLCMIPIFIILKRSYTRIADENPGIYLGDTQARAQHIEAVKRAGWID